LAKGGRQFCRQQPRQNVRIAARGVDDDADGPVGVCAGFLRESWPRRRSEQYRKQDSQHCSGSVLKGISVGQEDRVFDRPSVCNRVRLNARLLEMLYAFRQLDPSVLGLFPN
jgi:hypothetical protein